MPVKGWWISRAFTRRNFTVKMCLSHVGRSRALDPHMLGTTSPSCRAHQSFSFTGVDAGYGGAMGVWPISDPGYCLFAVKWGAAPVLGGGKPETQERLATCSLIVKWHSGVVWFCQCSKAILERRGKLPPTHGFLQILRGAVSAKTAILLAVNLTPWLGVSFSVQYQ